jgi:hypothetical protein
MKIRVKFFVLGFVLVCLAAAIGYAQQTTDTNSTSLGEIARKLKAQKAAKEAKEAKPVKVITNDTMPSAKDGDIGFVASTGAKPSTDAPAGGSSTSTAAHDEKYYRETLSKLQDQLDTHKRELDVLQQKLGQNSVQYYSDPNKALQQGYSREDINKNQADIDAKKAQIADDEKAIEDLHDQLRREGGDPSWLR